MYVLLANQFRKRWGRAMKKKITINDIAKLAGVSKTTVS
ncbi:MAG: LacI family DNA-binding transcriptional regulator, partial [Erysipelotrichia bacterium]|nr:LacI family DNA-binding transcriptional regulator [Erysipelotrichia bacterium]